MAKNQFWKRIKGLLALALAVAMVVDAPSMVTLAQGFIVPTSEMTDGDISLESGQRYHVLGEGTLNGQMYSHNTGYVIAERTVDEPGNENFVNLYGSDITVNFFDASDALLKSYSVASHTTMAVPLNTDLRGADATGVKYYYCYSSSFSSVSFKEVEKAVKLTSKEGEILFSPEVDGDYTDYLYISSDTTTVYLQINPGSTAASLPESDSEETLAGWHIFDSDGITEIIPDVSDTAQVNPDDNTKGSIHFGTLFSRIQGNEVYVAAEKTRDVCTVGESNSVIVKVNGETVSSPTNDGMYKPGDVIEFQANAELSGKSGYQWIVMDWDSEQQIVNPSFATVLADGNLQITMPTQKVYVGYMPTITFDAWKAQMVEGQTVEPGCLHFNFSGGNESEQLEMQFGMGSSDYVIKVGNSVCFIPSTTNQDVWTLSSVEGNKYTFLDLKTALSSESISLGNPNISILNPKDSYQLGEKIILEASVPIRKWLLFVQDESYNSTLYDLQEDTKATYELEITDDLLAVNYVIPQIILENEYVITAGERDTAAIDSSATLTPGDTVTLRNMRTTSGYYQFYTDTINLGANVEISSGVASTITVPAIDGDTNNEKIWQYDTENSTDSYAYFKVVSASSARKVTFINATVATVGEDASLAGSTSYTGEEGTTITLKADKQLDNGVWVVTDGNNVIDTTYTQMPGATYTFIVPNRDMKVWYLPKYGVNQFEKYTLALEPGKQILLDTISGTNIGITWDGTQISETIDTRYKIIDVPSIGGSSEAVWTFKIMSTYEGNAAYTLAPGYTVTLSGCKFVEDDGSTSSDTERVYIPTEGERIHVICVPLDGTDQLKDVYETEEGLKAFLGWSINGEIGVYPENSEAIAVGSDLSFKAVATKNLTITPDYTSRVAKITFANVMDGVGNVYDAVVPTIAGKTFVINPIPPEDAKLAFWGFEVNGVKTPVSSLAGSAITYNASDNSYVFTVASDMFSSEAPDITVSAVYGLKIDLDNTTSLNAISGTKLDRDAPYVLTSANSKELYVENADLESTTKIGTSDAATKYLTAEDDFSFDMSGINPTLRRARNVTIAADGIIKRIVSLTDTTPHATPAKAFPGETITFKRQTNTYALIVKDADGTVINNDEGMEFTYGGNDVLISFTMPAKDISVSGKQVHTITYVGMNNCVKRIDNSVLSASGDGTRAYAGDEVVFRYAPSEAGNELKEFQVQNSTGGLIKTLGDEDQIGDGYYSYPMPDFNIKIVAVEQREKYSVQVSGGTVYFSTDDETYVNVDGGYSFEYTIDDTVYVKVMNETDPEAPTKTVTWSIWEDEDTNITSILAGSDTNKCKISFNGADYVYGISELKATATYYDKRTLKVIGATIQEIDGTAVADTENTVAWYGNHVIITTPLAAPRVSIKDTDAGTILSSVAVTDKGNGTYEFDMPDNNIEVIVLGGYTLTYDSTEFTGIGIGNLSTTPGTVYAGDVLYMNPKSSQGAYDMIQGIEIRKTSDDTILDYIPFVEGQEYFTYTLPDEAVTVAAVWGYPLSFDANDFSQVKYKDRTFTPPCQVDVAWGDSITLVPKDASKEILSWNVCSTIVENVITANADGSYTAVIARENHKNDAVNTANYVQPLYDADFVTVSIKDAVATISSVDGASVGNVSSVSIWKAAGGVITFAVPDKTAQNMACTGVEAYNAETNDPVSGLATTDNVTYTLTVPNFGNNAAFDIEVALTYQYVSNVTFVNTKGKLSGNEWASQVEAFEGDEVLVQMPADFGGDIQWVYYEMVNGAWVETSDYTMQSRIDQGSQLTVYYIQLPANKHVELKVELVLPPEPYLVMADSLEMMDIATALNGEPLSESAFADDVIAFTTSFDKEGVETLLVILELDAETEEILDTVEKVLTPGEAFEYTMPEANIMVTAYRLYEVAASAGIVTSQSLAGDNYSQGSFMAENHEVTVEIPDGAIAPGSEFLNWSLELIGNSEYDIAEIIPGLELDDKLNQPKFSFVLDGPTMQEIGCGLRFVLHTSYTASATDCSIANDAGEKVSVAAEGTSLTVTAQEKAGYDFKGWKVEKLGTDLAYVEDTGITLANEPTATFRMPAYAMKVTALYDIHREPANFVIKIGVIHRLAVGTPYKLEAGRKWKVTGDVTNYEGGFTFYVSEEAEFTFE